MPTPEAEAAAHEGRAVLGGCLVDDDPTRWACTGCGKEWKRPPTVRR